MKSLLADCQQEQLACYWGELSTEEQAALADQILGLGLDTVRERFARARAAAAEAKSEDGEVEVAPPQQVVSAAASSMAERAAWRKIGLAAVARGEVAVLLLAGGQGTRLGSDKPKALFDLGLPSRKTLLQLQAERLLSVQREAGGGVIPWYIMVSPATQPHIRDHLEGHNHFGLLPSQVRIFSQEYCQSPQQSDKSNSNFAEVRNLNYSNVLLGIFDMALQGSAPCLAEDGTALLAERGKVATSPDGNGGLFLALQEGMVLSDMERRGVKHNFVYCVDNVLVRVADPEFIGYCLSSGADCGNKVIYFSTYRSK